MDKKTLTIIVIVLIILVGSLIYISLSDDVGNDQEGVEGGSSSSDLSDDYSQIPPPPALP